MERDQFWDLGELNSLYFLIPVVLVKLFLNYRLHNN
jgi:hypothetical protein